MDKIRSCLVTSYPSGRLVLSERLAKSKALYTNTRYTMARAGMMINDRLVVIAAGQGGRSQNENFEYIRI